MHHSPPKASKPTKGESLSDSEREQRRLAMENRKKLLLRNQKLGEVADGDVKQLIQDLMQKQDEHFSKLKAQISAINAQNIETQKSLDFLSTKYDELLNSFGQVKQENAMYKSQINSLERKLEQQEKKSKSHVLELCNVPVGVHEDKSTLCNLIHTLGDAIKCQIQRSDVSNIYRYKPRADGKPTPIVIELTTTLLKENFIKTALQYNKANKEQKLNTSHLNLQGARRPIYVCDSLTTKARRLYYLSREFVKNHKGSSCWTAYGSVYLREKDGTKPIRIECEEDIAKASPI